MRLTDVDVLMAEVMETNWQLSVFTDGIYVDVKAFLEIINNLPTIELEGKKGKWIKTGQSFVFPEKFRNYSCSECGHDVDKIKFNFCPNCGADMRDEQDR